MDDAMDVMDDEDLEEAADSEVDKVLYELTAGESLLLLTSRFFFLSLFSFLFDTCKQHTDLCFHACLSFCPSIYLSVCFVC